MSSISYNGKILPAASAVLEAGNRLFQYGDGLFETMRIFNGKILLADYHFDRLFGGMQALMISTPSYFTRGYLQDAILQLCSGNEQSASARIRLTVFRRHAEPKQTNAGPQRQHEASGEVFDQPAVLIESWPLANGYVFNNDPFTIDVYPEVRKNTDALAAYKTAAYLPYALAAVFARRQHLNDCLVLNAAGNVCDSSIANIFLVKDGIIYTPPLSEGCINGVMRRHIMTSISETTFQLIEKPFDISMLLSADEVFLTNVIRGIRPVTSFREANYTTNFSRRLFEMAVSPLTNSVDA
jgi:branched-chain amino acid aminotransferase